MQQRRWLRLAIVSLCSTCLLAGAAVRIGSQSQAPPAQTPVVQGGTLIDVRQGTLVPNSVIVIEGERIAQVGTVGQLAAPPGAQVIRADGRADGKFVMHLG